MFKLSLDMSNSAFEDPNEELALILSGILGKAERHELARAGEETSGIIRDSNGNRVGEWSCNLEGDAA
jgi:hypothetical protein